MIEKEEAKRTETFKRNQNLERLLYEVNESLSGSESELLDVNMKEYPIIFIVGPHRSGTTLMMQWLANTGIVAYPTNLMSRFYKSPILASKIQLLLTDKKYNYRNEIMDFNSSIDFSSDNGKTKGALAPNEFWYFWRNFLPLKDTDYLSSEELSKRADIHTFKNELLGVANVFGKPFALKALICNYNIDLLDKTFKNAVFIYTKRNPLTNIESALKARESQLGSNEEWYSFKIPEYNELKDLNPYEQVAGQIYYINKAVEKGLKSVDDNKKLIVDYESFCNDPKSIYTELIQKLDFNNHKVIKPYDGKARFEVTRKIILDQNVLKAYKQYYI